MATVADLIASPGSFTWQNSGSLASADVTGGLLRLDHSTAVQTKCDASAQTAPFAYVTVPWSRGRTIEVIAHVASPNTPPTSGTEYGGVMVAADSDSWTRFVHAGAGAQASSGYLLAKSRGATVTTLQTLACADLATGGWVRIVIGPDGVALSWAQTGALATSPPTTGWTYCSSTTTHFAAGGDLQVRVGAFVMDDKATPNTGWRVDIGYFSVEASMLAEPSP
jgi:hypothetical protein